MHTLSFLLLRVVVVVGVVCALGGVARGQSRVPERASVPVTLQAGAVGSSEATGARRLTLLGEGFLPADPGTLAGADIFALADQLDGEPGWYVTEPATVQFEPGRIYHLSVSGSGNAQVRLSVSAPAGYRVEINGRLRSVLELDGGVQVFAVRLVPRSDQWVARAGAATSLPGDQLRWEVALGALGNGESARSLIITDAGSAPVWGSIFTPAAIQFEEATSGVAVHRDGYALAQVVAPEAAVNVVTLSPTVYEIRFHDPGQVSGPGRPWTFSGEPFVTYRIEQGETATTLKITRFTPDLTAGGLAQREVTTLARTGTWPDYTWTRRDWHAADEAGAREEVRTPVAGNTALARTEAIAVRTAGAAGAAATQRTRSYAIQAWGEVVTAETLGTADPVTTTYDYYTDSQAPGSYASLKSAVTTGGSWVAYDYYPAVAGSADVGLVKRRFRPYLNAPAAVGFDPEQDGEVTLYDYAADPTGAKTRPTLVRTTLRAGGAAITVSEAKTVYTESAFTQHSADFILVRAETTVLTEGAGALVTRSQFFREDTADLFFRDQVHSVESPDGLKVSYAYQRGTWSGGVFTLSDRNGLAEGPASRVAVLTGTSGPSGPGGTSGTACTDYEAYDIDDLTLHAGKSTLELTIRDARARVVRTESHVWDGDWQLVAWTTFSYDAAGHLIGRSSSDNTAWTATYAGRQLRTETDHTGLRLTHTYDAAGRLRTTTKEGGPTTTFAYDAANRGLSETLSAPATGETLFSARSYDEAGRLRSSTPAGLGATTYSYNPAARTVTTTLPEDGATRTETSLRDGRLDKVEGSAVVPTYATYGLESDGRQWVRIATGAANSPRWQQSWVDRAGRPRGTVAPGFSPTGQPDTFEEHFYAAGSGRLERTTRQGYAPTRYGYDELGRLNRTGLDLGDNGLVNDSADRITETEQLLVSETPAAPAGLAAGWWAKTTAKAYAEGSATTFVTATTWVRLSGFGPHQVAESVSEDAEGNTVHRSVVCAPGTKTTTVTTKRSGFATDQVETIVNGLLTATTTHTGLGFTTEHDPLGRAWKSTDARGKRTTTTYKYGSALVQSVQDHLGHESQTFYDARGRVIRTQDAAGKVTRFSYNPRGQLLRQWGDAAYPVERSYDPVTGDLTGLGTFRSAPAADSVSWPSVGSADTTTFAYDPATGLLWKRTDAAGRTLEYTYNARGQVHQRFRARTYASNRVTTTYSYDPATGELTGLTHNDTTPSVAYTYNRLGQPVTITDSTGLRTFHYDPAKPWRQTSATLPAFFGGRTFTLLHENEGVKGRDRGYQLGSAAGSSTDLETVYAYTTAGRLETLAAKRAGDPAARTFRYGYKSGTDLVESLTIDGAPAHPFSVRRTYHPDLDLVTAVDTQWGGVSRARYDYTYNALWQRTTAKQSGDLFADYGEATYHRYTYNPRGELIAAPAYLGGDVTSTARPLPGRQHAYDYDSIGNRRWANRTGEAAKRESFFGTDTGTGEGANALNQYRSRENDTVPVQGTVDAPATQVAVVGAAATARQGRYFAAETAVGNAAGPWTGAVTTHAAKGSGGVGGADLVRTSVTATRIGPALQVLVYDDDGNLASDGLWDYQWDAENRLVRVATTAAAVAAGYPAQLWEYRYDYQGRRVMKRDALAAGSERRHLFVGWNIVAEFTWDASTSTLSLNRTFTWGLDLAGSFGATGGVGALLQIRDETQDKTLLPAYDGNGNVTALLDAATGAPAATYEYDPFGRLLRAEGSYAKDNTYRFSTKWHDDETGLVYYGHRSYSPALGRFINRDPIEEAGGLNLYAFAGNDGVNGWDYLGMNYTVVSSNSNSSTYRGTPDPSWTPVIENRTGFYRDANGWLWQEEGWVPEGETTSAPDPDTIDLSWLFGGLGAPNLANDYENGSYTDSLNFQVTLLVAWARQNDIERANLARKATIKVGPMVLVGDPKQGKSGGPGAPNSAGLPADAQPAASWSPYRWLYTGAFWGGDGRAPDNVYQAGVAAAAEWWDKNGAIRGVSVGVRANIGEGPVRINVAAGASVTIDKGFGGHASAGANLRSGALSTTFGGGVQYTEQNGWSSRPGASATVAGGRVSTGTADGGVGNLNIGFSTSGPVAITAGFVVDQHRAVNNVRETITIVRSWFGGPGP